MADWLATELATFEAHREDLLISSQDKFVLVRETTVAGVFDTEADAIREGYRRFGNVAFLVKQVLPSERPLNFVTAFVSVPSVA